MHTIPHTQSTTRTRFWTRFWNRFRKGKESIGSIHARKMCA